MSDRIFLKDNAGTIKGAVFYDSASDEIRIASYDSTPVIDGYVSVSSAGLTGSSIALSTGAITSGTWTPTGTATSNLDSVTPSQGQYIRVGNVVSGSVLIALDPTASGRVTLGLSLPVASDLTNTYDATGIAVLDDGSAATIGSVVADTSNDRLLVNIDNTATSAVNAIVSFTYQVIA